MGISEEAMVMRCILAAVLVASVLGVSPEEELDKLALHVEHYPHAQGSNHATYQFQIDNNNENDKTTDPVDFTAEVSPDMDVTNAYFFVRSLVPPLRRRAARVDREAQLPVRR